MNELSSIQIDKGFVKSVKTPFLIDVKGDEMSPTIQVKDKVIIDFDSEGKSGEIVAVQLNGELFIKELRDTRNGYILHSHNSNYNDIEIKYSDNLLILGKVVSLVRYF